MRRFGMVLLAAGLWASEPLSILSVERPGLPPYEDDARLYRLKGEAKPGDLILLSRPGSREQPGRLRVVHAGPEGILARLDQAGDTFPMVGDRAQRRSLPPLGALPPFSADPDLQASLGVIPGPLPTPSPEPRELRCLREPIYFLPGSAVLSPAGRIKVDGWAKEANPGQWTLECAVSRETPARLAGERGKAIKAALGTHGISAVQVRTRPGALGQPSQTVWLDYRESPNPSNGASSPRAHSSAPTPSHHAAP